MTETIESVTMRARCRHCRTEVEVTFTAEERREAHEHGAIPVKDVRCECLGGKGGFKVAAPLLPLSFYPVTG
jgi:hypothetical protein